MGKRVLKGELAATPTLLSLPPASPDALLCQGSVGRRKGDEDGFGMVNKCIKFCFRRSDSAIKPTKIPESTGRTNGP